MNDDITVMERSFTTNPRGLRSTDHFEVTVTWCDLVQDTMQISWDVKESTSKYAALLAEALVPSTINGKHIRFVQLLVKGEYPGSEIITSCAAGPFPCDHLTTGMESVNE